MEIALMVHSTGTGAAMAPIEIKKTVIEGVFKCRGYEEPKLTEHLTGLQGLGSNTAMKMWGAK
jgi:hypothetical protein